MPRSKYFINSLMHQFRSTKRRKYCFQVEQNFNTEIVIKIFMYEKSFAEKPEREKTFLVLCKSAPHRQSPWCARDSRLNREQHVKINV